MNHVFILLAALHVSCTQGSMALISDGRNQAGTNHTSSHSKFQCSFVPNAHVLIFLSLVQMQERLNIEMSRETVPPIFCYFSKRRFGLFLRDPLVLVCTSCNSAESTFCLSWIITCLFVVDNPSENSIICTFLSRVVVEGNERVRWEENAGKGSHSHASEATVQALTGKLWYGSRTEDTAAFSYIMILRLLGFFFSHIFCFLICVIFWERV